MNSETTLTAIKNPETSHELVKISTFQSQKSTFSSNITPKKNQRSDQSCLTLKQHLHWSKPQKPLSSLQKFNHLSAQQTTFLSNITPNTTPSQTRIDQIIFAELINSTHGDENPPEASISSQKLHHLSAQKAHISPKNHTKQHPEIENPLPTLLKLKLN